MILFPESVRNQALIGLVPALATDNSLRALEGYFSRLLSPYDPPNVKSQVLTELGQVNPEMATDGADALARVQCSVLLVGAMAPVDIERFRELQTEAFVGKVVGSGHWLTLVVPDQVNAMLDRFLELASAYG